jgi:hypothetical protein
MELNGYKLWTTRLFEYNTSGAGNLISNAVYSACAGGHAEIHATPMSLRQAFSAANDQINGMEAAGATIMAEQARVRAEVNQMLSHASVSPTTRLPAPPLTGTGVPPRVARDLVVVGPRGR